MFLKNFMYRVIGLKRERFYFLKLETRILTVYMYIYMYVLLQASDPFYMDMKRA